MNDDNENEQVTWCDVISWIDWLKEQTEKTEQATRDFENLMWLKREIERVEIEMAQK